MNYYEAQEFFKSIYPGKQISFDFDAKCYGSLEIVHTDGSPNILHHIESTKILVSVEGMDPFYTPIVPHRTLVTWQAVKGFINSHTDVAIPPANLETLATLKNNADPNYQVCLNEHALMSGLTPEQIDSKVISYDLKMKEKLAIASIQ
jgi:hypothetical protein